MNESVRRYGQIAIGAAVIVIWFVASCFNFGSAPNGRTFYYIDGSEVYYSPPLMEGDPRPFAFATFTQDAIDEGFKPLDERIKHRTEDDALVYANPKTMKWVVQGDERDYITGSSITREEFGDYTARKPDAVHRNLGGFRDNCGLLMWGLRKLGIAKPRFRADGGWNW